MPYFKTYHVKPFKLFILFSFLGLAIIDFELQNQVQANFEPMI